MTPSTTTVRDVSARAWDDMDQPRHLGGEAPLLQRPKPPSSILTAAKLMYTGAVLSALSLVATLAGISALRAAVRSADPSYSAGQLHTTETAAVSIAILVGLIGLGLWIWMAWANTAGKNWARVTASVILGLDTVAVLADFTRPDPLLSRLFSVVIWLVGLAVVVLLWGRQSSAYYAASRAS